MWFGKHSLAEHVKTTLMMTIHPVLYTCVDRVGQELEENLGQIQVVTGAVKIRASEAIVSLNFLRSLTMIQGQSLLNNR